jgi:hypothetical protein
VPGDVRVGELSPGLGKGKAREEAAITGRKKALIFKIGMGGRYLFLETP